MCMHACVYTYGMCAHMRGVSTNFEVMRAACAWRTKQGLGLQTIVEMKMMYASVRNFIPHNLHLIDRGKKVGC